MTCKLRNCLLLSCLVFAPASASAQESCVVAGDTLSQARDNYAAQCNVQRVDCDPFDGVWYCASFRITSNTPPALTIAANPEPATPTPATPTPVEPTPVEPMPVEPTPAEPTPEPPVVATPVTPEPVTPEPVTPEPESTPVVVAPTPVVPEPAAPVNNPVVEAPIDNTPVALGHPACANANSDSDGDGFGWENESTCLVTNATPTATQAPVVIDPVVIELSDCAFADSDSDGDGYGWENNQSCTVTAASVVNSTAVTEPETDQAEASPATTPNSIGGSVDTNTNDSTPNTTTADNNTEPTDDTTAKTITAADITDLILITGQSNALGAGTSYNPNLDGSNPSVFAFTNNGWQVADLHQIWDRNWFPRTSPDTDPSNNLSLHFGKHVAANDSSRVIGFVLASAPGAAISSWETNGDFYSTMETKALDAINQLPHKSSIDGILWHQGESDGRDEQYYTDALYTLISNLRNEAWVVANAPFICGETKIEAVNNRLNGLNTDTDPNTACVQAIDLPTLGDDRHFNAEGLRTLGARYGDAYLNIVN